MDKFLKTIINSITEKHLIFLFAVFTLSYMFFNVY